MNTRFGFSSLTQHAQLRLEERTTIDDTYLRKILDTKSYISIGLESCFDREHCLFYSKSDDDYFVAVQDAKTGSVITVLPIDYQITLERKIDQKFYWKIDNELLRRAEVISKYNISQETMVPKISLKVRYLDRENKIKIETVKKFSAEKYDYNPNILIENQKKINNLLNRWIKRKNIEEVVDVFLTSGRKASPVFVSQELVSLFNQTNNSF